MFFDRVVYGGEAVEAEGGVVGVVRDGSIVKCGFELVHDVRAGECQLDVEDDVRPRAL